LVAKIGELYDSTNSWQSDNWTRLIDLLCEQNRSQNIRHVVDLGCGSGKNTKRLLEKFPSITDIYAIDSNRDMLNVAKEQYSDPRIQHVFADLEKLNLPTRKIDLFIANYSLHWIKNKKPLLKAASSGFGEGTFLAVSTCKSLPSMLKVIDDQVRSELKVKVEPPFYYLNSWQWQDLLKVTGWQVISKIQSRDVHRVSASDAFFSEWYAASAGKAFYHTPFENIPKNFFAKLRKTLNDGFGRRYWEFTEETFLFIAKKV